MRNLARGATTSPLQGNRVLRTLCAERRDPGRKPRTRVLLLRPQGTLSERDELLGGIAKRPGALRGTLEPRLLPADTVHKLRLQLVLGDDRAEVSLDDLERLENWPLC